MYHNSWSAETHGDRQDNEATVAFITTNMDDPVVRAAGLESVEAWNRRCLTMEWDDDSAAPPVGPRRRMTSQLCKELSMVLINRVTNEIINGKETAESMQPMIEYLLTFREQSDLVDSDTNDSVFEEPVPTQKHTKMQSIRTRASA